MSKKNLSDEQKNKLNKKQNDRNQNVENRRMDRNPSPHGGFNHENRKHKFDDRNTKNERGKDQHKNPQNRENDRNFRKNSSNQNQQKQDFHKRNNSASKNTQNTKQVKERPPKKPKWKPNILTFDDKPVVKNTQQEIVFQRPHIEFLEPDDEDFDLPEYRIEPVQDSLNSATGPVLIGETDDDLIIPKDSKPSPIDHIPSTLETLNSSLLKKIIDEEWFAPISTSSGFQNLLNTDNFKIALFDPDFISTLTHPTVKQALIDGVDPPTMPKYDMSTVKKDENIKEEEPERHTSFIAAIMESLPIIESKPKEKKPKTQVKKEKSILNDKTLVEARRKIAKQETAPLIDQVMSKMKMQPKKVDKFDDIPIPDIDEDTVLQNDMTSKSINTNSKQKDKINKNQKSNKKDKIAALHEVEPSKNDANAKKNEETNQINKNQKSSQKKRIDEIAAPQNDAEPKQNEQNEPKKTDLIISCINCQAKLASIISARRCTYKTMKKTGYISLIGVKSPPDVFKVPKSNMHDINLIYDPDEYSAEDQCAYSKIYCKCGICMGAIITAASKKDVKEIESVMFLASKLTVNIGGKVIQINSLFD